MPIKFWIICIFIAGHIFATEKGKDILVGTSISNTLDISSNSSSSSIVMLVPIVIEKAQTILLKNPRFNNRDLIREFFIQNPHYQAPMNTCDLTNEIEFIKSKKVAIVGAGPGGLLAALILAHDGHQITVYEKRSKEEFSLRWQNISLNEPQLIKEKFPDLDAVLKSKQFVQYEMELDNPEKLRSYRIAIGDLQEALFQICHELSITIRYGENPKLEEIPDAQIIIFATGANTLHQDEYRDLREKVHFQNFPEYKTHGVAALYYEPETDLPQGLTKERIVKPDQGISWGFKVTMVGPGVQSQAARLATINPTNLKFTAASKNPALYWYLFATQESSTTVLPFLDPIDVYSFIDFVPSFAQEGAIFYRGRTIILWGDARTSSHPLTGAGLTIPFRSANALSALVRNFDNDESSLYRYNQQTMPLAQELFIKTLLVTLF